MVSFNAIFARKHGHTTGYSVALDFNHHRPVEDKYEELIGPSPAGEKFRNENAEIVVFIRGEKFAAHSFESKETRMRDEALKAHREHEQATTELTAAQKRAEDAKQAVDNLSDEHRALVTTPQETLPVGYPREK